MNIDTLMDSLAAFKQDVPDLIPILELRRPTVDDAQRRLKKFLKAGGEACGMEFDRGQWTRFDDRTLVRLPQGAYAVAYHASGAVKLASGTPPMENLFKEPESRAVLTQRAEAFVKALGLHEALGRGESLAFERLWQVKAAAADRSGKTIDAVLCRAVGAFRHHVEGIPVLGAASVAVQIAGDGSLDTLSMLVRAPGGEVLDRAKVLHPERAARMVAQRVSERFGQAKGEVRVEAREGLRFGYLGQSKRQAQRLLAPVYMATLDVTHEQERQGLVVAVPATERSYMTLELPGAESLVVDAGKLQARRCC